MIEEHVSIMDRSFTSHQPSCRELILEPSRDCREGGLSRPDKVSNRHLPTDARQTLNEDKSARYLYSSESSQRQGQRSMHNIPFHIVGYREGAGRNTSAIERSANKVDQLIVFTMGSRLEYGWNATQCALRPSHAIMKVVETLLQ